MSAYFWWYSCKACLYESAFISDLSLCLVYLHTNGNCSCTLWFLLSLPIVNWLKMIHLIPYTIHRYLLSLTMYHNMKLQVQLLIFLFTCQVTDMVGAILEGYPKSKKQFLVSHSLKTGFQTGFCNKFTWSTIWDLMLIFHLKHFCLFTILWCQ